MGCKYIYIYEISVSKINNIYKWKKNVKNSVYRWGDHLIYIKN